MEEAGGPLMSTDQPYAYVLRHRDSWDPPCFPTSDAAMRYVIQIGCPTEAARHWAPVKAHYADGREPEDVDVSPYMEEVPVDHPAIVQRLQEEVAADLERYNRHYPTDEDKAQERRHRCSGQGWLFERDLDEMVRMEAERQRWRWKELT